MSVDCYDFYLWSVGKIRLSKEPELNELLLNEEEFYE